MRPIVTGICGPDGYLMVRLLIMKGFRVLGLTISPSKVGKYWSPIPDAPSAMLFYFSDLGCTSDYLDHFGPDMEFKFAANW